MLAEIGDDRSQFADARVLNPYAGSAPLTRASAAADLGHPPPDQSGVPATPIPSNSMRSAGRPQLINVGNSANRLPILSILSFQVEKINDVGI